MSRKLFSVCFLLAVCGCTDTTNTAPATGNRDSTPTAGPSVANPIVAAPVVADPLVADQASSTPAEQAEKTVATVADLPAVKPVEAEPPKQVAADNKPNDTSDTSKPAEEPAENQEPPLTIQEAFAEAQKLFQKNDIAGLVKVLERALPGNPKDAGLLLSLAQFTSNLGSADPKKPDYAKYQKAGEYMRRALKANAGFAANQAIRNLAGPIFYNEARALALDSHADQALESLGEAIEFGFKDLTQMDGDADLKSVRALASYADFKTKAVDTLRMQAEAARAQLIKEVDEIFAKSDPFDFDFELADTDGKPIAMSDFAGKVVIVDVWGTWCPPCRMEIPHFVALQKNFEEAGLVIVGLNSERTPTQEQSLKLVQNFRTQNGMNYRCALVDDETLPQIPEFNAFPTTMFFDRNGNVRAKIVGYNEYDKLEIIVRKLLDEKIDVSENARKPKKKVRLTFGMAGFVRKSPWPVPEQGGVQAHIWGTSFSPDGKTYMAFGDSGPRGVVRLWDLATGKPLQEFRTDKDVWFSNARFLAGGQQVVTAYSNDKNIYLWDVPTGKLVHEFEGHTADGIAAYVSHDGRMLVSSSKDNTLRLWDVAKSQEVWNQDVAGEQITKVVFSSDDSLILTSGADRMLRLRELKTGTIVGKLEGHTAACAGEFSPDGKQVLSSGDDGQIRLWDISTGKTLQSFDGRPDAARKAWHLDDGRQILTWGKDFVFSVWDAATGRKLREINVADMAPPAWSEAAVSPDGRCLLVVNSDGADVRLVDIGSGEELYRSQKGKLPKARGFTFSADGRYVAAGSFRTGIYLLQLAD